MKNGFFTFLLLWSVMLCADEKPWVAFAEGGEMKFCRGIPGFVNVNSGNWSQSARQSAGSLRPDAGFPKRVAEKQEFAGTLRLGTEHFRLHQNALPIGDEEWNILWELEFPHPTAIGLIAFQIELPAGLVAGLPLRWDGGSYILPTEASPGHNINLLLKTPTKKLILPMYDFDVELSGNFHFSVIDARKMPGAWSNYIVRIHFNAPSQDVKQASLALKMRKLPAAMVVESVEITPSKEWKALDFPARVEPGSILDFSSIALDAPAGKFGRVIVRNGRFAFAENPDKRLRFLGVNLCYKANFPTHEQAEQLAEELAALGYNAVRFHLFDDMVTKGDPEAVKLNKEMIDRNDYFWNILKQKGFYISIDLYCIRRLKIDGKNAYHNPVKLEILMQEYAMRNLEKFTENFLSHVNPYSGMSRAKDPALMSIALINENSLSFLLPPHTPLSLPMRHKFDAASVEWNRDKPTVANPRGRYFAYLAGRAHNRLSTLLQKLGCQAPLTDLNNNRDIGLTVLRNRYDFVDNHGYHDHQSYPEKKWSYPMAFRDYSTIRSGNASVCGLMPTRIFGKPFTVSEYNFCFPNRFRAECAPVFGAYAALQDWDGLFRYNYAERYPESGPGRTGVSYDMRNDPIQIMSEKLIALLFLRGDVSASALKIPMQVRPDAAERLSESQQAPTSFFRFGMLGQLGAVISGDSAGTILDSENPATSVAALEKLQALPEWGKAKYDRDSGISRSSTGEITHDAQNETLVVVTPKTEVLTVTRSGSLTGNRLRAEVKGGFAVVSASAMDDKPLDGSKRILLLMLTDSLNTKTRFASGTRNRLEAPGVFPPLLRRGTARVQLNLRQGDLPKLYAVGMDGHRKGEVPVSRSKTGALEFCLDTHAFDHAVMAWELVR